MQRVIPAVSRLVSSFQVLFLALFLLTPFAIHAQVAGTGTIQGTVTDASGAVISGAIVTASDESTHVALPGKTDSGGLYVFPNIPIATYTVTITAPGFKTFTQTHNVLEVGSNIAVNVKMEVGSTTEKVEVRTDALALQTEDATYKQTIDHTALTEMPLNGRQMAQLVQYSGGTTNAGGGDFSNGSKYSYASISISVAGGQGNTTLYRLDGADNNDYMGNTNLPFPFPDAVEQFSVETSVLGAQDGMHTGGLVNVVTRSGTNKFHGSAFEFIRNNFIDATNFYAAGKDQLHQNEYGGTLGGPIKRDKLFAFAGYQFHESKQLSATTTGHVPTAGNLLGDFSVTSGAACSSTLQQLLDPLTGVQLPGNKYNQPGGPTLPAWNAQALALYKYLPTPDPTIDTQGCGVVKYATPNNTFIKQFITRADYNINSSNNLFARYMLDGYQLPSFFYPTNILVTAASGNPLQRVQTFALGENYTINSTTVNSARIAVLRRVNHRGYNSSAINAGTLGVTINQPVANGLQLATGGGVGGFTIGGGTNSVASFNDNTLAIDDELTLIRGHHQFVFGGEYVRNQLNINNGYESNGNFGFSSAYSSYGPFGSKGSCTQNPNCPTSPLNLNPSVAQNGDGALDFLEGTMSSFQQSKFQQNALRAPIPSLYIQDTYHATKQLTIVAGIRWSPEYMPVDTKNRGVVFNNADFLSNTFSTVYPGGPAGFPAGSVPNGAPAGALYYGDPGVSRSFTQNSPWQFDPNLGFAYDISGKGTTVIRGGAEFIYDEPNFFTAQRNQQNPPFATAISQASNGYIPFSTPWSLPTALTSSATINTNPFPQPLIPVAGQIHFYPNSQYIVLPKHFLPSNTMQWTASIQQQLGRGWQLQFDYIGNKTSHIELGLPLNPVQYIPGNWSGVGSCIAPGTSLAIAGTGSGACSTTSSSNYIARSILVLENPAQGQGYSTGGGGSVLIGDEGMANYNGLITSINHRLSSTLSLTGNWTWSKCLDLVDEQGDIATTSVQNPNNPAGDYGPCGFDYRNIENVIMVAKSNFSLTNRIEKFAVNGWELAPLMRIQTGSPFSVTVGADDSEIDVNNDRATLVPGQSIYSKVAAFRSGQGAVNRQYLNLAAFATSNAFGTFGTTSKNAFRTPPAFQMDAQLSRIFPIHKSLNMQLRLEGFNVLNHPNFGAPTTSRASGTFGQIGGTALTAARVFQGAIKFNF